MSRIEITKTITQSVDIPEGLPERLVVPCCPHKPGCGNTKVRLDGAMDPDGGVRWAYLRDNGDRWPGPAPYWPAEKLLAYLDQPQNQPWPNEDA